MTDHVPSLFEELEQIRFCGKETPPIVARLRTILAMEGMEDAAQGQEDENSVKFLHVAAARGHTNICKALLDAKADINAKNARGETPLHYATNASSPSYDTCQLLLHRGADVAAKNNNDELALHAIAYTGSLDLFQLIYEKCPPEFIHAVSKHGTPLHEAAKVANVEICQFILDNGGGSDINLPSHGTGKTPLLNVIQEWQDSLSSPSPARDFRIASAKDTMRLFLEAGSDPEISTRSRFGQQGEGKSALDYPVINELLRQIVAKRFPVGDPISRDQVFIEVDNKAPQLNQQVINACITKQFHELLAVSLASGNAEDVALLQEIYLALPKKWQNESRATAVLLNQIEAQRGNDFLLGEPAEANRSAIQMAGYSGSEDGDTLSSVNGAGRQHDR